MGSGGDAGQPAGDGAADGRAAGAAGGPAAADPVDDPAAGGEPAELSVISTVVSRADDVTVERAVMAVLALHAPNERGDCPTCVPSVPAWRRWRSSSRRRGGSGRSVGGRATGCPTRTVLWMTVFGAARHRGREPGRDPDDLR